jgi:hypothetical protein
MAGPRRQQSGFRITGLAAQLNGLVFMKPFAPDAIMKPLCPEFSAGHQWLLLQLIASVNGAKPGG